MEVRTLDFLTSSHQHQQQHQHQRRRRFLYSEVRGKHKVVERQRRFPLISRSLVVWAKRSANYADDAIICGLSKARNEQTRHYCVYRFVRVCFSAF